MVFDDLNGGELVWPLALVVSEDERNGHGAIRDEATGVAVGATDVMRDQAAIDVELGHHGRGRTTVGVKAKLEAGVVIGTYK